MTECLPCLGGAGPELPERSAFSAAPPDRAGVPSFTTHGNCPQPSVTQLSGAISDSWVTEPRGPLPTFTTHGNCPQPSVTQLLDIAPESWVLAPRGGGPTVSDYPESSVIAVAKRCGPIRADLLAPAIRRPAPGPPQPWLVQCHFLRPAP